MARPYMPIELSQISAATSLGNQPNHNLYSSRPRMVKSWSVTVSFPNFCPYFRLRTNQRKPKNLPNQSHRMPCRLQLAPRPATFGQNTPESSPFSTPQLSPSCLPWSLYQMHMVVADSLARASSEQMPFACSSLGCFHLFPHR